MPSTHSRWRRLGAASVASALVLFAGACNELFQHTPGQLIETDAATDSTTDVALDDAAVDGSQLDGADDGAEASPDQAILLASNIHLGAIGSLAVYGGRLYGTNDGTDPASGPMWSVSTSGGDFEYISPYDATTNGVAAVRQMGLSPPDAYFGVAAVTKTGFGVWTVKLDGSYTRHLFGFYDGVVLAVDPPGMPYVYVSDARNPGFVLEPKVGANPPATAIPCNPYPEAYPPALQLITDAAGNVYWAYNGVSLYMPQSPPVQGVYTATRALVSSWSAATGCVGYTALVEGVDVLGIGIDGKNVYWADSTPALWKVATTGGSPTDISSHISLPGGRDQPRALTSDGDRVYWVGGTRSLWAIAADGSTSGNAVAFVGPSAQRKEITAMAFDSQFIYFADSGDHTIWKKAK